MKTYLSTDGQHSEQQQCVADRRRKALRPLRWRLAGQDTPLDGGSEAKAVADPRRSVVITIKRAGSNCECEVQSTEQRRHRRE